MKKCSHCGKKSAFARERREGEKEDGGRGGGKRRTYWSSVRRK